MKELWVPLSGAIAGQRKVEVIANNVANANTPGFKKDDVVFKEYLTAYEKGTDIDLPNKEFAPEDFYRSYGAEHGIVKADGSYTIHSQGQFTPTQNPLDLALEGPGFIEILTPNGVRYTRRGSLSMSSEGFLVTEHGHPVLSKVDLPEVGNGKDLIEVVKQVPSPQERKIQVAGKGRISINQQGFITLNNNPVARMNIVEFKDFQQLKKEGNSNYINDDTRNIVKTEPKTVVHQGFIENSNVNAVQEMSELIKAHRHFESVQRVIKAYDNLAQKANSDITKF